jgi:hypothetical protein
MTASLCEKPTEIGEKLNSSRSDDFGYFFLGRQIDRLSEGRNQEVSWRIASKSFLVRCFRLYTRTFRCAWGSI